MNLAQRYIEGLKDAYERNGGNQLWADFERVAHGIREDDVNGLMDLYPDVPTSLIQILDIVDGTYWNEYEGEKYA